MSSSRSRTKFDKGGNIVFLSPTERLRLSPGLGAGGIQGVRQGAERTHRRLRAQDDLRGAAGAPLRHGDRGDAEGGGQGR